MKINDVVQLKEDPDRKDWVIVEFEGEQVILAYAEMPDIHIGVTKEEIEGGG